MSVTIATAMIMVSAIMMDWWPYRRYCADRCTGTRTFGMIASIWRRCHTYGRVPVHKLHTGTQCRGGCGMNTVERKRQTQRQRNDKQEEQRRERHICRVNLMPMKAGRPCQLSRSEQRGCVSCCIVAD